MNTNIKQRIAEWKAFTHPFADPLILKNLLTDCLKHIEELEPNVEKAKSAMLEALQWSKESQARESKLIERLQAVEKALELTRNWIRFNGHTGQHAHEGCKPCELQSLAEKALQKDAQPPKQ